MSGLVYQGRFESFCQFLPLVSVPFVSGLVYQVNATSAAYPAALTVSVPFVSGLVYQGSQPQGCRSGGWWFQSPSCRGWYIREALTLAGMMAVPVSVPFVSGLVYQGRHAAGDVQEL